MATNSDSINLSRTFKYLLATQFLSRGIPFIFNSWIVRHLTENDYVLYAVQFHLFVTCVLFLIREGFRRACLPDDINCDGQKDVTKLLKVAWVTFPLGVAIIIAACIFVLWWQNLGYSDTYAQAILIHGFACILELMAERLYILSQTLASLKLRIVVETVATFARCVTLCSLIVKQTNMSAKGEIEALEKTENELKEIEEELQSAEMEKNHYEDIMKDKVLPEIKAAGKNKQLGSSVKNESSEKSSIICPESEITALGPWDGATPLQLSAQINKINHILKRESEKYSESIDDLRSMHDDKERKIAKKRKTYKSFREKLKVCNAAAASRWSKLKRNKHYMKCELTWRFNDHLKNKGISGNIRLSYEDKTLSIEVKMPQDATSSAVRDTRGLSGGERSFSTLCFALALHNMTEAPIRGMDEFDVFMDAVSRKISLDTLVDFALNQGSQWIFITPYDISMVKSHEKIKKQQMAAPRS